MKFPIQLKIKFRFSDKGLWLVFGKRAFRIWRKRGH